MDLQQSPGSMRRFPLHRMPFLGPIEREMLHRTTRVVPFLTPELTPENLLIQSNQVQESYSSRDILLRILRQQYGDTMLTTRQKQNLDSLALERGFCVVTAHQPLLFGGKGYFLYKALTAIRLAEWASAALPHSAVVPVFVLGSEDHDLEEVRHFSIFNEMISWDPGEKGPIGKMSCSGIQDLVSQLSVTLQGLPHAEEMIGILSKSLSPGITFSGMTRAILQELLGEQGLLVVDLDHPEAKAAFVPVMEDELIHHRVRKCVDPVLEEMDKAGIRHQATGREINLFYVDQRGRNRIEVADNGGFHIVDTDLDFSKAQMLELLHDHPERFSPNVLLRPVYQQMMLPGLIFTGGPGELAYWMELTGIFRHWALPMPFLYRRDSVLMIDHHTARRLDKFGWPLEEWFSSPDELVARYVREGHAFEQGLEKQKSEVQQMMKEVREECARIDPTLVRSQEAAETAMLKQLDVLEAKMVRGLKHLHEQEIQQIRNIYQKIMPEGSLQERQETFLPWMARYGRTWINDVLQAMEPLQPSLVVKIFQE